MEGRITQIVMPGHDAEPSPSLTQKQRDACARAATELITAFQWRESAEGEEFWSSVYGRLKGLGKGTEPLK